MGKNNKKMAKIAITGKNSKWWRKWKKFTSKIEAKITQEVIKQWQKMGKNNKKWAKITKNNKK